jgi:hypothetical protein
LDEEWGTKRAVKWHDNETIQGPRPQGNEGEKEKKEHEKKKNENEKKRKREENEERRDERTWRLRV